MTAIKHIQVQMDDGDGRYPIGEVLLLDGKVEWTDNRLMEDFVQGEIYNPETGKMVTIKEPELFFETWVQHPPSWKMQAVDMADKTPDAVLPMEVEKRVSAFPADIPSWQETFRKQMADA